jgi:sugar lactone lactonase YvrE
VDPAPLPVPTDLIVETAIPGVVAAGTPMALIKTGFEGAEGPVGMPDGSVLFTETRAARVTRIDPDGNTSTFVEHANESNGLGFDPQGRLISVQRAFNVVNIENFTINARENNAQYLKAITGENRTMQFGFRVTF